MVAYSQMYTMHSMDQNKLHQIHAQPFFTFYLPQQCQERDFSPLLSKLILPMLNQLKKLNKSLKKIFYFMPHGEKKIKIIHLPKVCFLRNLYYFTQRLDFLTLKITGTSSPNHFCGTWTFNCQQFMHITFKAQG